MGRGRAGQVGLEALKERTRERVQLQWAATQNNLGAALGTLGERESGAGRLGEAVIAYREALKERTRDRVPLHWAATQNNPGALSGTDGISPNASEAGAKHPKIRRLVLGQL